MYIQVCLHKFVSDDTLYSLTNVTKMLEKMNLSTGETFLHQEHLFFNEIFTRNFSAAEDNITILSVPQ